MASPVQDARVEDFLNDKFQTLADLDTLDELLSSVQNQQSLLRSQLEAAETAIHDTEKAAYEHSEKLLNQAQLFQQEQIDIDQRLQAIAASEETKDAARQIQASMDKLQRLEVAKGYVELIQLVHNLSEEAWKQIDTNPKAALVPYKKLQHLYKNLKARHEETEEAAVHLVYHVERTTSELWDSMKEKLSGEFQAILTRMGWPLTTLDVTQDPAFEVGFCKLLDLQEPELESFVDGTEKDKECPALLPFEVMAKPLGLRFRYHFEGDKQTNRLDKPEWFFNHILTLIEDYTPFANTYIQPLLDKHLPSSGRDAVLEFITAVLPMLRRKIRNLLPQIVQHAQLLSHFIHEMIKFDTVLRDDYLYAPYGTDAEAIWEGITHEVLVKDNWFAQWLKVEKDFALSRYQNIVNADDAWQIDYDSVEEHEAKPTKSAMRVKDLLETITERYRPLTSFMQRLRFLIDIQINVLDQYLDKLNSSVEAFRVLSSSIARAVQGTSKEEADALKGIPGLERLCRVYGSAMYLEGCMRDWGEDVFFLEIWEELHDRSLNQSNQDKDKQVAGNMTIQDVADKTSSAVVSGDDDGALFDETAGAFKSLQERTEEMIIEHVGNSVIEELRAYTRITIWSSIESDHTGSEDSNQPHSTLTISPEIAQPLATLSSFYAYTSRVLTAPAFRRIVRQTMALVQTHILDYVVARSQFSAFGARQLARDCTELWAVSVQFAPPLVVEGVTRRLKETCLLLILPMTDGDEVPEREGFQDVLEEAGLGVGKSLIGIRTAVGRAFEDNEEARGVMEELGIRELLVAEVRGVLRRRVEAWA
ncbi:TIP-1 family-domain-containing protein [Terfezia claveryi]|nr:TIP-1 family-domain-containing protein [Terfezia claveryi]